MDPGDENLLDMQERVKAIILARHTSDEWVTSPNRNPQTMRAAYTTAPVRTKTLWKYDHDKESSIPVQVPVEYMYTADEMQSELSRRLLKAETTDPYAHPDYKAARFSCAELLEHVVPYLPKCQPMHN